MKFNTSFCLGTLAASLAIPLWAAAELPVPTAPEPPEPPAAEAAAPAVKSIDAPTKTRTAGRARKGEMYADVLDQTREMGVKMASEAKLAAEHARRVALDVGRGFRRGEGNRTLVLPSGTAAPESLTEGHEDLSVMSRILNKVVEKESRRSSLRGFAFSMGETGSNLDAMYLEGYGAVFLLNADFPLVAPPSPNPPKAAAKDEDPTWERTKRELRGRDGPEEDAFGGGWSTDDDQPKYDAEKVEALKRRLIDACKHGKNLRSLKEAEHLTVIVFGKTVGKRTQVGRVAFADAEGGTSEDASSGGISQNIVGYVKTDSVRQSTLALRVQKSAIDGFAAGTLTAEEFARRVSVSLF